jgi:hypothetical protein
MLIEPPYCGAPRESHQCPVVVVVLVSDVVSGSVLVIVVMAVVCDGVVLVLVVAVVVVVGLVLHDASSIAVTSKKLKPNQINLFFNFYLPFY